MFMPALARFSSISEELLAGPIVQMIFVVRKSRRADVDVDVDMDVDDMEVDAGWAELSVGIAPRQHTPVCRGDAHFVTAHSQDTANGARPVADVQGAC
jgi:hypothetical protein